MPIISSDKIVGHEVAEGQLKVSIRLLDDSFTFKVPEYQRGFRWTRQQIKELIDDLYEFGDYNAQRSQYCLQNITVRLVNTTLLNTEYEVVDGQQRLTAIWILSMAYLDSVFGRTVENGMPRYILEYEGKPDLTKYVKDISDSVRNHPAQNSILTIPCSDPNDIDCAYIHDAFVYITSCYKYIKNGNELNYLLVLNSIFDNRFVSHEKKVFLIWNEILPPKDKTRGEKTKYIIERFSNLNANKIPLTESELIKAYFINSLSKNGSNEDKIQEFSLKWEEIERGLSNDDFWFFITSGENIETRTDLLFQIYLDETNSTDKNGQHVLSRKMSQKLMQAGSVYDVWQKGIVQVYETLMDWYSDYYYYHVIGLIIALENNNAVTTVKNLFLDYCKSDKKKFRKNLKEKVRAAKEYDLIFREGSTGGGWKVKGPDDIRLESQEDQDKDEISYKKHKEYIKPILLLFNIALLVNAYRVNKENDAERFPFKIYKSNDNPIEIEHINPQHLEGKEFTSENKLRWAEETLEIIQDKDEKKALEKEIKKANWDKPNIIDRIESAADLHLLNNLTLVDKRLNIGFADSNFQEKRNHILAARFGAAVPSEEGTPEKLYGQSVIFPGTMWVFMRQYIRESLKDKNTTKAESKNDKNTQVRWNATDREEYIRCMQKSIYDFLRPDED